MDKIPYLLEFTFYWGDKHLSPKKMAASDKCYDENKHNDMTEMVGGGEILFGGQGRHCRMVARKAET